MPREGIFVRIIEPGTIRPGSIVAVPDVSDADPSSAEDVPQT
jgi:MOSC domain-containing protein YiiM